MAIDVYLLVLSSRKVNIAENPIANNGAVDTFGIVYFSMIKCNKIKPNVTLNPLKNQVLLDGRVTLHFWNVID